MGSEWTSTTLGEVIELKRGYDLPKRLRVQGQVPLISSAGVSDFHSESKVAGPGVVTGRYGTIGEVFFSPQDFWPLNTTLYVRDFKGNDPKFIYYFLKTLNFDEFSDKAAVPGVNRNHVHMAEVSVPSSLPEQKAIAHILGTLDDKIELNRRMNATLEGMAQALFKSWFVDFDPVIDNALAAGNPIPDELAPRAEVRRQALANGTANRAAAKPFPAAFQETESMGWIPEGWEVQEFGKLAQNIRDGVDPSTLPDETPYVGLEHIDRHSFSISRWGAATDVDSQKSHFIPKDFLFGKLRPYFHKVCRVTSEGICSTDILVIRPHKEKDAGYVGCQIFEPEFVEYANLRSTGTRMPRASWKDMAKYEVACPPESLRKTFNRQIEPIREKCAGAVAANQTLTRLRDTLLPKLISGELRIPEAEQLTEEPLA